LSGLADNRFSVAKSGFVMITANAHFLKSSFMLTLWKVSLC